MSALEVKNLKKGFKKTGFSVEKKVLNQIDFSIKFETTTGFLGTNGSGKTTTLKCVLGLLPFHEGTITFFDGLPLSQSVLKRVGFLPEQPCFYDYLTGEELLVFYGRLSSDSVKLSELKSRARSLLKRLDLYFAKDQIIKTYSKGMLQKIGLAQALIHKPDFIILDEPMAGLDPDGRRYVSELIQDIVQQEGASVFFSSHLLHDVERLCQDVVILKEGAVIYQGSIQSLLDRVEGKREILYLQNARQQSLLVNSLTECQKEIDQLRKQGCDILQVHVDQRNLEHIFAQMASREKQNK